MALRQLAAAQFLPTLNGGGNYDAHTGNVQQADGNILNVNRNAPYVGAGANAVAGGTVNIPGVVYNVNVSQTIFNCLSSRQQVVRRRFSEIATQNEMLRRVAMAYLDLLRTEGLRGPDGPGPGRSRRDRTPDRRLRQGEGGPAGGRRPGPDRAAKTATSTGSMPMRRCAWPGPGWPSGSTCPRPCICVRSRKSWCRCRWFPITSRCPSCWPSPCCRRPESARRAAIRQALLELDGAKALPFSPNLISGFSSGTFGGGSNLAPPGFGSFDNRNDVDVVLYWTVRNLGLGNVALIRLTASQWRSAQLEQIEVLNQVRSEVAQAHARIQVQYARMLVSEKAVPVGVRTLKEEMQRIRVSSACRSSCWKAFGS